MTALVRAVPFRLAVAAAVLTVAAVVVVLALGRPLDVATLALILWPTAYCLGIGWARRLASTLPSPGEPKAP